jgi:NADH-quinone oxidoreductase subunit C
VSEADMSETTVNDDAATDEPGSADSAGNGSDDAAAPADELRAGLLATFTEALGEAVVGSHISPGHELWVRVDRTAWVAAAELAKTKLGCTFFDFLSAIDWMPSPWGRYEDALIDTASAAAAVNTADSANTADTASSNGKTGGIPHVDPASIKPGLAGGDTRFQVLCRLADVRSARSVVLKADLPDDDLRIASLSRLYPGANWHERECWEMFGITFDGHPGLRHLYLPGGFEGHPLRKDFPLLARLVKPWPGIVDVEPMPDDPAAEADPAEADPSADAEGAATGGHGESDAEAGAS